MSGQLDRSAMTALQNIAGNNTQGAITTGTFEFDEDTMRQLVSEWLSLADDYDLSWSASESIAQVKGPGLDFASTSHAGAANASGRAYLDYLQHNRAYCIQQAQLFQNALHDYLGIEHTNVTQIGDAGQPLDTGPKAGI
jgi:hypothetical protein